MKLVSMKLDPAVEKAKYAETVAPPGDQPMYPWGLSVRLDEDAIAKLGLTLPEAGSAMMLHAKVLVTEVMSREEMEDGKAKVCRSATLQITDLGLEAGGETDAAKALYKE